MRKSGKTDYRKEQFKLLGYLQGKYPYNNIELEHKVFSTDGGLIARIDVADVTNKIAYRLRSAFSYHDSRGQSLKDELQKEKLEFMGWTIIDITEDSKEWGWLWI